jgi:RNA polymerase sigma-70 factor (ECF subfamily)
MIEGNDLHLVEECLKGNRKAFGEIVDKYQKPLYNAAYRILGSASDAEEVTQAAFVKAFEGLGTFRKGSKFFSWLYRIAVNESLNYRQARRQHEQVDEERLARPETPETEYGQREMEAGIQEALNALTDEYRTVIVLRHFQELSYDEISAILGIPAKTVKSRLFSARQQLRDLLPDHRQP